MANSQNTPRSAVPTASPTGRIVLISLAAIFGLVVINGIFDHYIRSSVDARTRRIERDSIVSVEQLSRITGDVNRQRALVSEHILENEPAKMRLIEQQMMAVRNDLEQAIGVYGPLVELPTEDVAWAMARGRIDRLQASIAVALALSRVNRDVEAVAQWQTSRVELDGLDRALSDLIGINRRGALDSIARIETDERVTGNVADLGRLIVLAIIGALGWWLARRVAQYEARLSASLAQLEDRNRDLDAFAGRVAHDLKNALGPVAMTSDLIRQSAADPERVRYFADRTDRSAQRAARIIDALLAFAQAARQVRPDESVRVPSVVADVIEEIAPVAEKQDVALEADDIADVIVRCEPGLLHVALANLVGNAVKYLDAQAVRHVRISARRDGDACRIEVADTGPGIPAAAHERIFEPFYRVGGTRAPGVGIGLATVRRIVDARGGRIAVESEQGHGARFMVWLPLAMLAL